MTYYINKDRLAEGVKKHNEEKVYQGFTLFAPMNDNKAWLINNQGDVVHRWIMPNEPGVYGRLQKNGNLIWMNRGPDAIPELTGAASSIIEVDWDGNEVWRYEDKFIHHDFVVLPNNNILLMRFIEMPEEIQKRMKSGIPGTEFDRFDGKTLTNNIVEINRKGEIVWEWKHFEHFDPGIDIECPLGSRSVYGYTNSLDVFPNGDILISVRLINTTARINKKTGKVIWRFGPKEMVGHQHCVSVLDNGNIMLFDNGLHRNPPIVRGDLYNQIGPTENSRILEVNPENNEIVWEYTDPANQFYTPYCGSAERLPNGNTMICESLKGRFFEVTKDKEIVWDYVHPFAIPKPDYFGWTVNYMVFQIRKYGLDFAAFKGKDLSPDKFKLKIEEVSKDEIDKAKNVSNRLAMAGY